MKTKKTSMFVGGLMLAVVTAGTALAAPMLVDWQDGETKVFTDWTAENLSGGAAKGTVTGDNGAGTAVGANVNAIMITANTLADPPVPKRDVIYNTALIGDMGAYGPNNGVIDGVRFDFYAGSNGDGTGAPAQLGVYFEATGGHVWYYDINPATLSNGWNENLFAGFDYDYGYGWYGYVDNAWSAPLNTSAAFIADLGSVDRLGIYIMYNTGLDGQVYGIDNFGLTVPEPETYVVLGMALLSVAFVFRKRITDSLAEARAMIQM